MPYHEWGDNWFQKNGADLDEAISYCCKVWTNYGRIGTHGKEKYGTFRNQLYFYKAYWPVHELVKPGYIYYQWSKKIMHIESKLGYVIRFFRLQLPITWWQRQVYNYAIQQACKRWPNIVDELVSNLDGYECVRPGIFGPIDGTKIHFKYWRQL